MAGQFMLVGTITAFMNMKLEGQPPSDSGNPSFAVIVNNTFTIAAYIPFSAPIVRIGQTFTLAKIGNTYTLGIEVQP